MFDLLERLQSALKDRYTVERELGRGGMATVYLAEDRKHDRKVAIKVLKPELAAVLGAERFVQEIKTTAALTHPHILPLFDSGRTDEFLYYVMPYLQGETLREKLNREAQLGVDEAVRIATEVADALQYAHQQGVIHRDIKPENILLHAGRPMVMDFGIALAVSAAGGGRRTETGLSLGTPHYMSPEQATADKEITNRSDIYSLASVLYEMLAGDPPFTGSTAQAILLRIISDEVTPVRQRRRTVPANVAAALAKALEKLPADRFDTAKSFAEALGNPGFRYGSEDHGVARARPSSTWAPLGALGVVLLTVALWAVLGPGDARETRSYLMAFRDGDSRSVMREGSGDSHLGMLFTRDRGGMSGGSLSPDGSTLAFVAHDESSIGRVMLQAWGDLEPVPIEGTEGAEGWPVWSPDGSELAFTQNGETMIGSAAGGAFRSLTRGGVSAWKDGQVYVAGPLRAVPVAGGAPDTLVVVEPGSSYSGLVLEDLLPGGDHGLVIKGEGARLDLFVLDMRTGELADSPLVRSAGAAYASSGHLLFQGPYPDFGLFAAAFDPRTLTMGPPVALIPKVHSFSIAENGTLFYAVNHAPTPTSTPVWVRRDGSQRDVVDGWEIEPDHQIHGHVALSPDGKFLVVTVGPADLTDFWLVDLATGGRRRITDMDAGTREPRWSDDGRLLVFLSQAQGRYGIWSMRLDEPSAPAPVISHAGLWASDPELSPDGTRLVYVLFGGDTRSDLYSVGLNGDGVPRDSIGSPLVNTGYSETSPDISPDGRWIAYTSNQPGQAEIFVQPFPEADGQVEIVSVNGGRAPRWSPTGDELFYWSASDSLVSVQFSEVDGRFVVRRREALFAVPRGPGGFLAGVYDVAPGGQEFVLRRLNPIPSPDWEYVRVEHFLEEVRRRIPN